MNFPFNINEIFQDEITVVDGSLASWRQRIQNRESFSQLQNKLCEVVDKMGEASAKAQGLHGPITTSMKLKASDQKLYIMKESSANNGHGSIIGILKVGRKKLFVYDNNKVQQETYPLCVLDFYIHESQQRKGCGRRLFDFMLKKEAILVHQLAIDRPSAKLLSFLSKHYQLQNRIPQVNNFVIFDGFFSNRSDFGENQKRRIGEGYNNWSSPGTSVAGFGHSYARVGNWHQDLTQNVSNTWMTGATQGQYHPSQLRARDQMYSRHGVPADRVCQDRSLSFGNFYMQPPSSSNKSVTQNRSQGSTHSLSNMADTMKCQDLSLLASKKTADNSVSLFTNTKNQTMSPVTTNCLASNSQALLTSQLSQASSSPQQEWKLESPTTLGSQPYQHRHGQTVYPVRTMMVTDKPMLAPLWSETSNHGTWTVMTVLRDQGRKALSSAEHSGKHNFR